LALLERITQLPRPSSACLFRGVLTTAPGPAFSFASSRCRRPTGPVTHDAKSSASSWQDLLLGPGGAPSPPERAPQLDEAALSLIEVSGPGTSVRPASRRARKSATLHRG